MAQHLDVGAATPARADLLGHHLECGVGQRRKVTSKRDVVTAQRGEW